MTEMKIGSSYGGMTNFSSLGTAVREPAQTVFYPYATSEVMASGISVGKGAPYVSMYWTALKRSERDMLRTFYGGGASDVYVLVPTNENNQTFANYKGKMEWPVQESWKINLINDFTLKINHLVAVSS